MEVDEGALLPVADPGFVKREGRESKLLDAAPGLKKSLSGRFGPPGSATDYLPIIRF